MRIKGKETVCWLVLSPGTLKGFKSDPFEYVAFMSDRRIRRVVNTGPVHTGPINADPAHTGPVEYETRYSTSALKDMLDSLEQRKRRLMVRLEADGFLGPTSVYMIDGVERNNYGELYLPERYP